MFWITHIVMILVLGAGAAAAKNQEVQAGTGGSVPFESLFVNDPARNKAETDSQKRNSAEALRLLTTPQQGQQETVEPVQRYKENSKLVVTPFERIDQLFKADSFAANHGGFQNVRGQNLIVLGQCYLETRPTFPVQSFVMLMQDRGHQYVVPGTLQTDIAPKLNPRIGSVHPYTLWPIFIARNLLEQGKHALKSLTALAMGYPENGPLKTILGPNFKDSETFFMLTDNKTSDIPAFPSELFYRVTARELHGHQKTILLEQICAHQKGCRGTEDTPEVPFGKAVIACEFNETYGLMPRK